MKRWYLEKEFTRITKAEVDTFLEGSLSSAINVAYYQIIVNLNTKNMIDTADEAEEYEGDPSTGKFDISFFESEYFITLLKKKAFKIAGAHLTKVPADSLIEQLSLKAASAWSAPGGLPDKLMVTKKFIVTTGLQSLGALYKFQVIFAMTKEIKQSLLDAEGNILTEDPDESLLINLRSDAKKTYALQYNEDGSLAFRQMDLLTTLCKQLPSKNSQLEKQYKFDFGSLSREANRFKNYILSEVNTQNDFADRAIQDLSEPLRKKLKINGYHSTNKNLTKKPLRFVEIRFKKIKNPGGINYYAIVEVLTWFKKKKNVSDWPTDVYTPWKPTTLVSAASINKNYSTEFINLLYYYLQIEYYAKDNKDGVDVVTFVNKFIRPIPDRKAKPIQSRKINNLGDIPYKTQQLIDEQSLITDQQKKEIFNAIKLDYNNISDQSFLEILKNIDNIKNLEDVYKQVIQVIPLEDLIGLAGQSVAKYLQPQEIKNLVMDTVLRNLNITDMDKIVNYLDNISLLDAETANRFNFNSKVLQNARNLKNKLSSFYKKEVAVGDSKTIIQDVPIKEVSAQIADLISDDLIYKDLLKMTVLNSIPEAGDLLKKLDVNQVTTQIEGAITQSESFLNDKITSIVKKNKVVSLAFKEVMSNLDNTNYENLLGSLMKIMNETAPLECKTKIESLIESASDETKQLIDKISEGNLD